MYLSTTQCYDSEFSQWGYVGFQTQFEVCTVTETVNNNSYTCILTLKIDVCIHCRTIACLRSPAMLLLYTVTLRSLYKLMSSIV
jgi:hypothetical protein